MGCSFLGNCNGDPITVSAEKDTTRPKFVGWSVPTGDILEIVDGQIFHLYFDEPIHEICVDHAVFGLDLCLGLRYRRPPF